MLTAFSNKMVDVTSLISGQFDLAQPLHQKIMRQNRFRRRRLLALRTARGQRIDQVVRADVEEEGHRIACPAHRVAARIDHPVRGRAQAAIGQPFQHVAAIDRQRTRRLACSHVTCWKRVSIAPELTKS